MIKAREEEKAMTDIQKEILEYILMPKLLIENPLVMKIDTEFANDIPKIVREGVMMIGMMIVIEITTKNLAFVIKMKQGIEIEM